MKRSSAVAVLVLVSCAGELRAQPPSGERDLGAEVHDIFARKCASCHGSDLPKPKGRFGYVLDLKRVASNPEMIIPGRADESELWVLVSRGEMPPPDASHGPLTATEKEAVRGWIAAGALEPRVGTGGASPAPAPAESAAAPTALAPADRLVRLLGRFHLLFVHFPIALVLAAVVGEFLSWRRGTRELSAPVGFCLALAAVAVVPTVVFGWFHAASGNGIGSPQLLSLHRWLGTLAGTWVLITALCAGRDVRCGVRSRSGRFTLIVAAVLVAVTAHAGGLLTHGRDFFDW
jgi:uncharacterized membrane protein/mono/diheme cytochrome c family protein